MFGFSWQLFICVSWQPVQNNSAISLTTMKLATNSPFKALISVNKIKKNESGLSFDIIQRQTQVVLDFFFKFWALRSHFLLEFDASTNFDRKYCRIWSWSSMPCEKHGPRASVTTKTSAFCPGFYLLRPSSHIFSDRCTCTQTRIGFD